MNIQGFQKMTLLDFPQKVAATVFTGGCNLRCPFCHNGELVRTPTMYVNMETEVLAFLTKRRGLLDGVCITGGEPLLQSDLIPFLEKVKKLGYAVKLDTNGSLPHQLQTVLSTGLVDYVAMDIKSSPKGYPLAIGGETDFSLFAESIRMLQSGNIPHEFRTTVVKGIHTMADIEEIARMLQGDTLYFLQRYRASDQQLGDGCDAFSPQEMREMLRVAQAFVPNAALRGCD